MNYNIPPVMDIEKCPGYGFFPTEECLVDFFLAKKNSGQAKKSWPILEIDLCDFEPRELLDLPTGGCENYKYFFNRRQYANETKQSYKRSTKTGYWKSTGKPRVIRGGCTKRSLVFTKKNSLRGSKEVQTGWTIQEYDNGGKYVIAKLRIKDCKTKKSKSRHQNVSTDDFAEDNQIIYQDTEVQNIPKDASTEDNQIDSHDSENLSGFEGQNLEEMMVLEDHNNGETSYLMAPVYNKNSFSNESGGGYQLPAISSDPEYYMNNMTANYSAAQDSEVVPPHFVDQNWKDVNITMLAHNTVKTIGQEGFSSETENQLSTNESEGEWSPPAASPDNNFPNEAIFSGEGIIFSSDSVDWSLHDDSAVTHLDQSSWWTNMYS